MSAFVAFVVLVVAATGMPMATWAQLPPLRPRQQLPYRRAPSRGRTKNAAMTHHTAAGHRAVVEGALDDWWLATDPAEPFNTPAVAEHIEMHLVSSGYAIVPNTPRNRPVPTRRAIATATVMALICTASVIFAALQGDWGWASAGALATLLLTREGLRDIHDRRNGRTAR